MSNLTAGTMGSGDHFAVNNDTTANSGTQCHHCHVLVALTTALPAFTQSRYIGIIACGECVINCPNRAWTRSEQKYYRLTLLGRTGRKNPRMGIDVIKWADEESIIKIILNTYDYVKEYIDPNAPGGKEHIGYIVDRTGVEEFLRWALKDVHLSEKAEVYTPLYWTGVKY